MSVSTIVLYTAVSALYENNRINSYQHLAAAFGSLFLRPQRGRSGIAMRGLQMTGVWKKKEQLRVRVNNRYLQEVIETVTVLVFGSKWALILWWCGRFWPVTEPTHIFSAELGDDRSSRSG
jgi:hypothetical protein